MELVADMIFHYTDT